MATLYLPRSRFQVMVSRQGCNMMVVDDAIQIARMEGLEGFAVVLGYQLIMPPGVPPAGQGLTTPIEYRKRLVMFYKDIFREASYRRFRSVFLPKLSKGNHDDLMLSMLVKALTMFEFADTSERLHPTLNQFVVLCAEKDYEHVLCRLTTLFIPVAPARNTCGHSSVRQQTPAENARDSPTSPLPLPHPHPHPHPHPPSSHQWQPASAGQSGDSGGSSRSCPARPLGTGSCFGFNFCSFPSAAVDDLSQGGTVLPWLDPVRYHNAGHWRPPAARPSHAAGRSSRGGHCESGRNGGGGDRGDLPLSGEERRPSGTWSQFFVVCDQRFEVQATYLASRRGDGVTGRPDPRDPPCLRRCHYAQRTEDFRVYRLDNYVSDEPPRRVVGRRGRRHGGGGRRNRIGGGTAPRHDESDGGGETSATLVRDRSRTREPEEQAASTTAARMAAAAEEEDVESSADSDDDDDDCAVCLRAMRRPTRLRTCGHVFCRQCLEMSFGQRWWCPLCRRTIAVPEGNMPDGAMQVWGHPASLPGYEAFCAVVVEYDIHSGLQQDNHPNPGVPFPGTRRAAYLPASEEGFTVCRLLWVAFQFRLTFTLGRSMTTGRDNVVVWNIRHKTSTDGGPRAFGYPDTDYLGCVTAELAANGITEEFIQGFDIPF